MRTYWFNGNHPTRQAIADHIRDFYPNLTVITLETCKAQPTRLLIPVPPEDFQNGVLKQALGLDQAQPDQRKPISLKPLSLRRPLWR
jgi:hypothetical protein